MIPPTGAVNLNRMSNLLDFEVWNNNNEQIGSVNAIVIDKDTSQIEYVIVGTGGFLGLGESELPVPWQVLQLKEATAMEAESSAQDEETQVAETPQNAFILDITQEELEQAPEFDLTPLYSPQEAGIEGEAPEAMSLEELEQEIQSFWQSDLSQSTTDTTAEATEAEQSAGQESEQIAQTSGAKNLVLADDLFGATVQGGAAGVSDQPAGDVQQDATQTGPAPEDLGIVEEIMVDLNTGKVSYLLVSLNLFTPGVEAPPASGLHPPPAGGVEAPPPGGTEQQATIQVVPVPLTALEWNAEEAVLIYTGSEALEQAPTVDLDEILSDQSTTDWKSQADSFWGMEGSESETQ